MSYSERRTRKGRAGKTPEQIKRGLAESMGRVRCGICNAHINPCGNSSDLQCVHTRSRRCFAHIGTTA